MPSRDRSRAFHERAQKVLVGGVNSPVRSFRAVGTTPVIAHKSLGPFIWDTDGNRYADFCLSWGVFLLGHCHPGVASAAAGALANGSSFGLTCPFEMTLAELILSRLGFGEKIRFVNSGTEATMTALRLARAVTGRNCVIKFDGCYHGHSDSLLVNAGSGLATLNISSSAGVPESFTQHTVSVPYNDTAAFDEAVERYRDDLAAVIIEPVAANMGLVPPVDGYLRHIEEKTHAHGALLIFDEVITGFRFKGYSAARHYGIDCDLMALGKIIGGGYPAAAVVGPAKIMDNLAPLGKVYQAGTLSGNPVAMAAGLATIKQLVGKDVYTPLLEKAEGFFSRLRDILSPYPVSLNSCGLMFSVFFRPEPPGNLAQVQECDLDRYARFFCHLLEKGYYLVPSQFETNFISIAHTDDLLDGMLEGIREFMQKEFA